VDRGFLLGAQALLCCHGRAQNSDMYMSWSEKLLDHDDKLEVLARGMTGYKKNRQTYPATGGGTEATDHGVFVIDAAVAL
jgi:hypothetical protein